MPNTSAPMGLFPILRGAGGNMADAYLRTKAVDHGTRIRQYDVVAALADGTIGRTITPGTTPILGVALDGAPASTASVHHVIEEPDAIYVAQVSGVTGGLALDVFSNANILLGTTSTIISDDEINQATLAGTASLDLKLLRLHPEVDKGYGQFAVFEVQINKAMKDSATAGV